MPKCNHGENEGYFNFDGPVKYIGKSRKAYATVEQPNEPRYIYWCSLCGAYNEKLKGEPIDKGWIKPNA